jgi:hypothetical protein
MEDATPDRQAPPDADRLREAVDAANTLLYHAISSGQDLPDTVRDPIIHARGAVLRGEMTAEREAVFLAAYSKLAVRVAPVTAATLDATGRRRARSGRLGRLVGLRPVSDAQRLASRFGVLALGLILMIAATEWTSAFIGSILTAGKQVAVNVQEMRDAYTKIQALDSQIQMLTTGDVATADSTSAAAVRETLKVRRDELQARVNVLGDANFTLIEAQRQAYSTLERIRVLGHEEIKLVIVPLAVILGTFLLPVLYGALGTCAFVMRSLFREMADRTFDGRRTGEFVVRIFLGMLSGLTLQWLVVRPDGTVAGGVTPAVLAFIGGYSVEMLFTAIDRLVLMVTGRSRASSRGPVAPRLRQEPGGPSPRRPRPRPIAPSGPATPSPAANGVARTA